MQTLIECIPCFVRQAEEAVALSTKNSVLREEILRKILHALADAAWADSPPAIAQRLHRIIRKETGEPDPYRQAKDRMNGLALEALPCCTKSIAAAADPQEAAVRVAVAGNLLDSGAKIQIQPENLPGLLATLWDKPLAGDPRDLFRAADKAERILYLADNAGESNYETLSAVRAPIFFLFIVKCPIVATQIGESTGTMVVTKSALWCEPQRTL